MNSIKKDIKTHSLSRSSEEVCGFLVKNEGGALSVIKCNNCSSTPSERFEIHPEDYLEVKLSSEIIAIYHSHPQSAPMSQADLMAAEAYALPCVLYIVPDKEFDAYYPRYAETEHIEIVKDLIKND